jgi:hypothetical protein
MCLLCAFPATYGYKLIQGSATAQLFPGGVLPSASANADDPDDAKGKKFVTASVAVGLVAATLGFFADISEPPRYRGHDLRLALGLAILAERASHLR